MISHLVNMSNLTGVLICDAAVCCNRSHLNYLAVVLFPIFFIIGIIGNALTGASIIRAGKFHVKDVFIFNMALCDGISSCLVLPKYLTTFAFYIGIPEVTYPDNYIMLVVITWLGYSFGQSSDIILLFLSLERLMACRGLFKHNGVAKKSTWAVLLVLAAIIFGHLQRTQYLVQRYYIYTHGNMSLECGRHLTDFVKPLWMEEWFRVDHAGRFALQLAISVTLFCANVWILIIKRQSARASGNDRSSFGRSEIILLGSSFLFLFTQLPTTIDDLLAYTLPKGYIPARILANMENICSVMSRANYSLDFLLYLGFSSTFRRQIRELLCCSPTTTKETKTNTCRIGKNVAQTNL